MLKKAKCNKEFPICQNITVSLGNICRVEYIKTYDNLFRVEAKGDPVFLRYFDVEQVENELKVQIKNPGGSAIHWEPYDREGYTGENLVQIYIGQIGWDELNINSVNYLDLDALSHENEQGNYEVICSPLA